MKFLYEKEEWMNPEQARQNTFLLTNGLGGYVSVSSVFCAPRSDQGVLVAAVKAPNERINLVHRLSEKLIWEDETAYLSAQTFADGSPEEDGQKYLRQVSFEYVPQWTYEVNGVWVERRCCMAQGANTAWVLYTLRNTRQTPCTLEVTPVFKFAPKEEAAADRKSFTYRHGTVSANGYTMYIQTDGMLEETAPAWEQLSYPEDDKDGRSDRGMAGRCCRIRKTLPPMGEVRLEVAFSLEKRAGSGWEALEQAVARMKAIEDCCGFADPVARQLAMSADAYIARRDSTGGKTILAGYPLFSDWGRDTMIALPGCTLSTGRQADAKSILRTFLAYEKDGLVPNLFPEGNLEPMYNTVDAALLLIDGVWQYVQRTQDWDFAKEAWPVLERIVAAYQKGTHHGIGMDADGLIFAGQGLDQVTWMDVCVQGILPTPRHGKPVEINAYWYSALKIMSAMAQKMNLPWEAYEALAQKVRDSFNEKFYMAEKGYLRDVLSGTDSDEQIRCNQIWALSMPFTMLTPQQERQVLDTVSRHLYTPYGLRTLSAEDPQYHPHYGGPQLERDLAYHQGTTWVFPMGAYYRAYLKVHGYSAEAITSVKAGLGNLVTMMHQGCAGQLPEIYDGENPQQGKGCFAQAWSVGEMLRVYEEIEKGARSSET